MGSSFCVNSLLTQGGDSSGTDSTLRAAAVFFGRWLVIAAAAAVVIWAAARLLVVVLPLALAILLASLLRPFVAALSRRGMPLGAATAIVVLTGLVAVTAVLLFVVVSVLNNVDVLAGHLTTSVQVARDWAVHGPLRLAPEQLAGVQQQLVEWLSSNRRQLTQQALTTTSTMGTLLTGALLTMFALVFFLYQGPRLWTAACRLVPASQRSRIVEAGRRSFRSLTGFMRATAVVAAADAVGIGLGLVVVGVPLAGPITALVFLSGFLPVVGALVSGLIAVLVAAVTRGLIAAVIVLVVVVAVQQLEGNVLQPWLLGDAVRIHPVAIVFGVTAGSTLAGVSGALLAVPLMTTVHTAVTTWTQPQPDGAEESDGAHAAEGVPRHAGS